MTPFDSTLIDRLREALAERPPVVAAENSRRRAAVLVPLFVAGDEVHVVLTRKSERLRSHQGQVSFPGGGWDPADGSLAETALREADEEVGIHPGDVELLGQLDDLPTATTNYLVRSFVGVVPYPYEFVPDGFEVERVFTPPLAAFVDPALQRVEVWERNGRRFPMTFYDVDGEVVWGVTARIIALLFEVIEGRRSGAPLDPA